jgi:hypothetical protein
VGRCGFCAGGRACHSLGGSQRPRSARMTEQGIGEHSIEEPEEDVAEQSQEVSPVAGEARLLPEQAPLEANEADVEEQARVVELDEDEYH